MDLSTKFLLVELLTRYSSICQWVNGINHEVWLSVVFQLQFYTMAMGPDCFHDNLCSWYLLLDVMLQNAVDEKSWILINGTALLYLLQDSLRAKNTTLWTPAWTFKQQKTKCLDYCITVHQTDTENGTTHYFIPASYADTCWAILISVAQKQQERSHWSAYLCACICMKETEQVKIW